MSAASAPPGCPWAALFPRTPPPPLPRPSTRCRPCRKRRKKLDSHLEWLLHKPVAPAVPPVKNSAWLVNPIDAFILQKLEAKGMTPAPPASKRALLRRVYFDLIGLPPTPEEIQRLRQRPRARCLRKGGRQAPRRYPVRRTLGPPLARPRAVRRIRRLRDRRRTPDRVAIPRLRDPLVQSGQAVRPVRPGAACRRRDPGARRRQGRRRRTGPTGSSPWAFCEWEPGRPTPISRRNSGRMS